LNKATFRFYEELNDFLPARSKKQDLEYDFEGSPAIKDPIEAIGIPHTEVELIVVNGASVDFGYRLQDGDRVAVYPVFESFDIAPILKLREKPLRNLRFVCDVHLGKLARYLRMLGFDTLYRNDYRDAEIVYLSVSDNRIVLTRDRRLLYHRVITHGYWIRSDDPDEQMREVIRRFDLREMIRPMHHCPVCNGIIEPVSKQRVWNQLEPLTKKYYNNFYRCRDCGKAYWKGSHYERIHKRMQNWRTPDNE